MQQGWEGPIGDIHSPSIMSGLHTIVPFYNLPWLMAIIPPNLTLLFWYHLSVVFFGHPTMSFHKIVVSTGGAGPAITYNAGIFLTLRQF